VLSLLSQLGLAHALPTITLLLESKVLQGRGSGSKYVKPELYFQVILSNSHATSS